MLLSHLVMNQHSSDTVTASERSLLVGGFSSSLPLLALAVQLENELLREICTAYFHFYLFLSSRKHTEASRSRMGMCSLSKDKHYMTL